MDTIIIAAFAIFVLLIQRAESTVDSKYILAKIELFHWNVKSHMKGFIENPYAETRRKSAKWIAFLFFLVVILHYISEETVT
ncbi:hypothetical protein [Sphingobacterium thalpophilum]|uniref:hypothetical protein n=1 Tax=Sphingobacterium thalpophilum TaxID=259 RepID=UPI002D798D69|nr:hypothetical protein [Sphingobacterium thalpophilum]